MTSRWREEAEADPEAGGEESDRDRRERYTETERHSDGQTDRQSGNMQQRQAETERPRQTETAGRQKQKQAESCPEPRSHISERDAPWLGEVSHRECAVTHWLRTPW